MIINFRSRLRQNCQKGSTMVNLLFLIIILAIVLMNGDAVARLATTPVYNFQTQDNVRKIVKAVNSYKVTNGGNLPQNNADIERILNRPLLELGPAGADYDIYYESDQVTVKGVSPTEKIYKYTIQRSL